MEVAAPCIVCKALSPCGCKDALVSYLGILQRVQERVLREQAASNVGRLPIICAGVDKLDANFIEPISARSVLVRAKALGCDVRERYLKERNPFLEISRGDFKVHFRRNFDRQYLSGFLSNPNSFKSWKDYTLFLESILSPETIQRAQIYRLDLNMDFSSSFQDLIQSIDVKNKRLAVNFMDKSGERTGLTIGKGKEEVVIYDKAKKSNLADPCTRIELRLRGNKLPTRSITEIPTVLSSGIYFEGLEWVTVSFPDRKLSEAQTAKLNAFKLILRREGFFTAKKEFSKDRNFNRDFAKLINVQKINATNSQLNQVFRENISEFLQSIKRSNNSLPERLLH